MFAIFIFEVYFSETYLTTSAENSISEPAVLKILQGEDTPRPPYKARAFGSRDNAPRYKKNLATALGNAKKNKLCHFKIPFKSGERKGDLIYKLLSFIH